MVIKSDGYYLASSSNLSSDTGSQILLTFLAKTTPLSMYTVIRPKLYKAFPSYCFCPGMGMKRRPLSSAWGWGGGGGGGGVRGGRGHRGRLHQLLPRPSIFNTERVTYQSLDYILETN